MTTHWLEVIEEQLEMNDSELLAAIQLYEEAMLNGEVK